MTPYTLNVPQFHIGLLHRQCKEAHLFANIDYVFPMLETSPFACYHSWLSAICFKAMKATLFSNGPASHSYLHDSSCSVISFNVHMFPRLSLNLSTGFSR